MEIREEIQLANVQDRLDGPVIGKHPEPPPRGRLSVVEMVYYQAPGQDARSVDSRFSRWVDSEEEPFSRNFVVGESWTPLPKGWIDPTGMMVLKNHAMRHTVTPTEAEKAEAANRIVEVSFRIDHTVDALLLPNESLRLQPTHLSSLRLRCLEGQTRCTVTLLPTTLSTSAPILVPTPSSGEGSTSG